MGRRGPPPKPTRLNILHGNPGKRPLNKNEPQPGPAKLDPPKWLGREGKVVWREYAPPLHALGLLTELDVELFAHACALVAVARRLLPGSAEHLRVVAAANRILSCFGFSPSARGQLHVAPVVKDDFADFLAGKGPKPAI